MKRLLAGGLILCLMTSMTGCALLDYQKANTLYNEGNYAQAEVRYAALGDFADSADMARISGLKADYAKAEALYASGNYDQALTIYTELDRYVDSPLKAVMCRYEAGKACVAEGNYEEAVAWLDPLGGYEDSAEYVNLAKWNWLGQQKHEKELDTGSDRSRTLSIEMTEKDVLVLRLSEAGMLLGLPYKTEFEMTLVRGNTGADYVLVYNSTHASTITETATGTVELRNFAEGLPVAEFNQRITDAEGAATESYDVTDAIMTNMVMGEIVTVVLECLPQLLESSGVNISMTDLGF